MTPIVCDKGKNIGWALSFGGAKKKKKKKCKRKVEERKIRTEEKVKVHGEKIHTLLNKFIGNEIINKKYWRKFQPVLEKQDIPTAVYYSGATSHCGRVGDAFFLTRGKYNKIFQLPDGHTVHASGKAKLYHNVREPANTVDIIPILKLASLLSASKFAYANYILVLKPTEVKIYNANNIKITVTGNTILRG